MNLLLLTHLRLICKGVYLTFCHASFLLQWHPKTITITLLRSISREVSEWITRELAPSSFPSVCLWMITLPKPWVTNGCRSSRSLLPVPPLLPAVQALLTPPPTATAQICPAKNPPAAHRHPPAVGLWIKTEMTSVPGGKWTLWLLTFHCVQLCLLSKC